MNKCFLSDLGGSLIDERPRRVESIISPSLQINNREGVDKGGCLMRKIAECNAHLSPLMNEIASVNYGSQLVVFLVGFLIPFFRDFWYVCIIWTVFFFWDFSYVGIIWTEFFTRTRRIHRQNSSIPCISF